MRPRANSNVVIEIILHQYGEEVLAMASRGCSHGNDNARKLPEAFGGALARHSLEFAIQNHRKKDDGGLRGERGLL